ACLGGRGLPCSDCKCHKPGKDSAIQKSGQAELFWRDSARSRHAKSGEELPRKMRTFHEKLQAKDPATFAPPPESPREFACWYSGWLSSASSTWRDYERVTLAQRHALAGSK